MLLNYLLLSISLLQSWCWNVHILWRTLLVQKDGLETDCLSRELNGLCVKIIYWLLVKDHGHETANHHDVLHTTVRTLLHKYVVHKYIILGYVFCQSGMFRFGQMFLTASKSCHRLTMPHKLSNFWYDHDDFPEKFYWRCFVITYISHDKLRNKY